jgi:hypothetical protein
VTGLRHGTSHRHPLSAAGRQARCDIERPPIARSGAAGRLIEWWWDEPDNLRVKIRRRVRSIVPGDQVAGPTGENGCGISWPA